MDTAAVGALSGRFWGFQTDQILIGRSVEPEVDGRPEVNVSVKITDEAKDKLLKVRGVALDCAVMAIAILPLLLTKHLPLMDLPNHLARQYILRDVAQNQTLQTFYFVHWALVPNLALELFVFVARHFLSIDIALRVFCIITILTLFAGTRLMNRTLGGGQSRIYRIVPLLCYSGPFQFGFLSFCFGVGLALVFFGLYLRLRNRPLVQLVLIFAPLSIVVLLCHLAAFGAFAVAIASSELTYALANTEYSARRVIGSVLARQARVAMILMPAVLLYEACNPMADAGESRRWSSIWQKAEGIAAITVFSSPGLELALLGLAFAGMIAAVLTKTARLHRDCSLVVIVLVFTWLVLPRSGLGGGYIDYRIPWAASFFLLAGLVPGPAYEQYAQRFGGLFGLLVLARVWLIAWLWLSWEPIIASIDNALSSLPSGARLMVVEGQPSSTSASRRPPLNSIAAYAVARRQAFEPNVFASIPGQIIHLTPRYKKLWTLDIPSKLDHLAPDYNYVLVLRPEVAQVSPLLPLVCESTGPEFELFKVDFSDEPLSSSARRGRC